MSNPKKTNVGKLLRVLVAGGLGLVGVAGVTRADDKAPVPAEKTEKAKEKDKAKEKGTAETKKEKDEKKAAAEKKEAESDGGGVKGW